MNVLGNRFGQIGMASEIQMSLHTVYDSQGTLIEEIAIGPNGTGVSIHLQCLLAIALVSSQVKTILVSIVIANQPILWV